MFEILETVTECDKTVMLCTYFVTHFNSTVKNKDTEIMHVNTLYLHQSEDTTCGPVHTQCC